MGESQKEKIHGFLEKTKVPYQGSWRKVFEQTHSQQTDNKEQTSKLENLFSIQNLKISFIGFVIVSVMCILIIVERPRLLVWLVGGIVALAWLQGHGTEH